MLDGIVQYRVAGNGRVDAPTRQLKSPHKPNLDVELYFILFQENSQIVVDASL